MTRTPQELLNLDIEATNTDSKTLGQYLFQLLEVLIIEGEGFDLEEPFGIENWHSPIIHALILSREIDGELDEFGRIDDYNSKQYTKTILDLFTFLQKADYSTFQLPPAPKDHLLVNVTKNDTDRFVNDWDYEAYTKEEAERLVNERNFQENDEVWHAIHIPA